MAETHKLSQTKLLTSGVVLAVVVSIVLRLVKNVDPEPLYRIDSAAGYVLLAVVTTVVAMACTFVGARYVNPVIGVLLGGVAGGFATAVFASSIPGMFWGLFVGTLVVTRRWLWRILKWIGRCLRRLTCMRIETALGASDATIV